jgi:cytidylate kinase
MTLIRIAVDGYASTGKSTLAKRLASSLGFLYIDTGAMYRMVALYAIRQGWAVPDTINAMAINASLDQVNLAFARDAQGQNRAILNGEDVDEAIRTMEVSRVVSSVSSLVPVRRRLVAQQQAMGHSQSLVMDGRDIGTVVFPDAELKVFLTASAEERAARRYRQLIATGDAVSLPRLVSDIEARDRRDTERVVAPLRPAADAVELDTTGMGITEVFDHLMRFARERGLA